MRTSERWSALVLAAGAGERMGCIPKPLIAIDGETIVDRMIAAVLGADASEVVVVLGHHLHATADAVLRSWHANSRVRSVFVDPPGQQTLSLHSGLHALRSDCAAAMVCLADQPLIDVRAVRALRLAFDARPRGTELVIPWVDGTPGNPVMLSPILIQELLGAGPTVGGREWRQANPERVHRWLSGNTAYRLDLDTPADLDALRRTGITVCIPESDN